ncbi:hypothetical protein [Mycolicibacter senuensis]|uniref:hypothetical protein n=1 Tax=Mycolicibacter senuensis TaxID=386913 RepID=UPI000DCE3ED5|nr:hypothetical protein [Mycolicibacter senuensis]RAV01378.1 hypothetical protein DQP56_07780 [Mycolicibacter senuensis]
MTDPQPHAWPACPWPGWAGLYARMIRDARAMDPELIVEDFEPGSIHPNSITSLLSPAAADELFDRIEEAGDRAGCTCVVCGGEGSGWPPLRAEQAGERGGRRTSPTTSFGCRAPCCRLLRRALNVAVRAHRLSISSRSATATRIPPLGILRAFRWPLVIQRRTVHG